MLALTGFLESAVVAVAPGPSGALQLAVMRRRAVEVVVGAAFTITAWRSRHGAGPRGPCKRQRASSKQR